MTINPLLHPAADVIVFPMVPQARPAEPAPVSRAEHDRKKLLDIASFEAAVRLAEGARQSAVAAAAAELQALGNGKTGADYDWHNLAVDRAERTYLETVIAAADQHGVASRGWKTTLQTLPKPVSARQWAEGRGKW
jgi:hypothetical protein